MRFRLFARRRAFRKAVRAVRPAHSGRSAWVFAALLAAMPLAAPAQVLEIDEGGGVKVYDGPSVVTSAGTAPIATPRRATRPRPPSRSTPAPAPLTANLIGNAAQTQALSPALIEAVAWAESRLVHGRVSRAGAVGEMQLMPDTARTLRVDPSDSRQNYQGGAEYLRMLMNRYNGDLVRTLAAYNAGPQAVDRYGGVPPYKDTQAYVAAILARLSRSVTPDTNGAGK
jgi:soluble lytic murein transglycosylase-like protein